MKTILIEDEKAAARNLTALLAEVAPQAEILTVLDSVTDSIGWLDSHPMPEVVFMDIHLADGSAFEIFEHVHISCPIIFTTAYDEYALRAFKVNSVDYLLKPIGESDLRQAVGKLVSLRTDDPGTEEDRLTALIRTLRKQECYKTHFLIPYKGGKLLPLATEEVQYFCVSNGLVQAVVSEKERHTIPYTLDELADSLDPRLFFRANRQYLISRNAVLDIDLWFNNRLAINLKIPAEDKILVSRVRVNEFKTWFSGH